MSVVVAGLLAIVVGATIVEATHSPSKKHISADVAPALQPFFNDARVQHELAHKGFTVETRGSNPDVTFSTDPEPGGVTPFSTPLVAVTSAADAQRLAELGIAQQHPGGAWSIDTVHLMTAITTHRVAVQTGGPTSPAGSYFAALLAGTQRGASVNTLVNMISPAYKAQPPDVPTVKIAFEVDPHPADAVVMYPNPDVVARATLVAHTPAATDFGRVLTSDAALQKLAAAIGYRDSANAGAVPVDASPIPAPPVFSQLTQLLETAAHV